MKANQSISSLLSDAITFLRDCEKEYQYNFDKVGEQDKKQNDLLHFLELDKTEYSERCKTATQLRHCLLERRYYKDRAEERAPIAEFLADPQNKKLLDSLGRVLGEIRKVERYHANRSYSPRVLRRGSSASNTQTENNNI